MNIGFLVFIAFAADLAFGDPECFPHPVRLIGKAVSSGERLIRGALPETPFWETAGGCVLAVFVAALSFILPWVSLYMLGLLWEPLKWAAEAFFCWQIFAAGSLKKAACGVYRDMISGGLSAARKSLSLIVGRDTAELGEEGVSKAAVETVAENTSDGVIAPMIFMLIGGAPLGFLYKSINTMDSMIGYKNEKYLYFGRAAARLDDAANFIPARITAALYVIAAALLRLDWKSSLKTWLKDGGNHSSPNSGRPEAACAGALNIELGGPASYFGRLCPKPFIGRGLGKARPLHILKSTDMLIVSSVLGVFIFCGVRMLV